MLSFPTTTPTRMNMRLKILFSTIALGFFASCNNNKSTLPGKPIQRDTLQTIKHKDNNSLTVFLNIEYAGELAVFEDPNGRIKETVQNDIANEDFVMFDLLQKKDSFYYVVAYSSLDDRIISEGWIKKNNKLGIYSAAYGDLDCILYEVPFDKEKIVITEKEYNPNIYEVLDFEGKWLKVRIRIEDKVYIGWMPPEIQCSNPYTTCS